MRRDWLPLSCRRVLGVAIAPYRRPTGESSGAPSTTPCTWLKCRATSGTWARGQITLNLGVYFRAVAALDPEEGPPTESPTAGACLLRRRISRLMPGAEDHWWSIDEQTDLRELGDELAATWIAYGEPWFGSVPDLATAAAQLERDGAR
jgi:hypothetical protein